VRHQNALPRWIKPQLIKLVDAPPEGSDWLHEIKFDGYRIHAWLDHGTIRLLTRTGLDWTHKYPAIAAAVSSLRAKQAYLDGELCGIRSDGHLFEDITRNKLAPRQSVAARLQSAGAGGAALRRQLVASARRTRGRTGF
jgi:ATP-dependent DNA ligase